MTVFIAGKRGEFQLANAFGVNAVPAHSGGMSRWIGFSEDDGRYARRGLRYQAAQPRPLANALRTTRSTFAQLPLKNDAGDRVMFGVTESDEGRSYAAFRSELLRGT